MATAVEDAPRPSGAPWWAWIAGLILVLFVGFEVYGPALNGEFVFDDQYLPFMMPDVQNAPLQAWLGVRPFLQLTYWWNYQNWGLEPYPYHAVSVVLHCFNTLLIWAIVRRFLKMVDETGVRREILAAFAAGLFLLHPVITESVAYVTSRSEALSIFFFLLAYAVFLFRPRPAIPVPHIILLLLFFGIACTVKEHTTFLPFLLLLTDFWFTTPFRFEGIRRNLHLYIPIAFFGLIGIWAVFKVLSGANSAGFRLAEFTWYQYLFTQFRVIWTYLRLYLLPVGQNGDYAFPPSRIITEHFAWLALFGLLAVCWLAWRYRREYPLASFGWFGFLLLLAPTSSVVPIADVIVERRLYLPFFCLLLITVDFLRRWRPTPALLASACGLLLAVSAYAAHERSKVWSSALVFWGDAASKAPTNARARFQLAYAQWVNGQCDAAVRSYEETAKITAKSDDRLLVDWGLALECAGRTDDAAAKMRQAYAIAPSAHIQTQIGMIYGKKNRFEEAMAALNEAEKLDPRFEMTYVYKGNLYATRGEVDTAIGFYKHAIAINPNNQNAKQALDLAEQGKAAAARQPGR
ncbi:MAG: tetratricopeptide repeat protein [Bryobacteraceae bacterium]|nr:tetratricopeptide repeat protein [Bryobacteraceae bacterium]